MHLSTRNKDLMSPKSSQLKNPQGQTTPSSYTFQSDHRQEYSKQPLSKFQSIRRLARNYQNSCMAYRKQGDISYNRSLKEQINLGNRNAIGQTNIRPISPQYQADIYSNRAPIYMDKQSTSLNNTSDVSRTYTSMKVGDQFIFSQSERDPSDNQSNALLNFQILPRAGPYQKVFQRDIYLSLQKPFQSPSNRQLPTNTVLNRSSSKKKEQRQNAQQSTQSTQSITLQSTVQINRDPIKSQQSIKKNNDPKEDSLFQNKTIIQQTKSIKDLDKEKHKSIGRDNHNSKEKVPEKNLQKEKDKILEDKVLEKQKEKERQKEKEKEKEKEKNREIEKEKYKEKEREREREKEKAKQQEKEKERLKQLDKDMHLEKEKQKEKEREKVKIQEQEKQKEMIKQKEQGKAEEKLRQQENDTQKGKHQEDGVQKKKKKNNKKENSDSSDDNHSNIPSNRQNETETDLLIAQELQRDEELSSKQIIRKPTIFVFAPTEEQNSHRSKKSDESSLKSQSKSKQVNGEEIKDDKQIDQIDDEVQSQSDLDSDESESLNGSNTDSNDSGSEEEEKEEDKKFKIEIMNDQNEITEQKFSKQEYKYVMKSLAQNGMIEENMDIKSSRRVTRLSIKPNSFGILGGGLQRGSNMNSRMSTLSAGVRSPETSNRQSRVYHDQSPKKSIFKDNGNMIMEIEQEEEEEEEDEPIRIILPPILIIPEIKKKPLLSLKIQAMHAKLNTILWGIGVAAASSQKTYDIEPCQQDFHEIMFGRSMTYKKSFAKRATGLLFTGEVQEQRPKNSVFKKFNYN